MTTQTEALKLALEALYFLPALSPAQNELQDGAIEAIKEALEQPYADKATLSNDRIKIDSVTGNVSIGLAQPEQEPVACVGPWHDGRLTLIPRYSHQTFEREQPLYTTPPQRTWVGLTDEDRLDAKIKGCSLDDYIQIVEAKLKEKNT